VGGSHRHLSQGERKEKERRSEDDGRKGRESGVMNVFEKKKRTNAKGRNDGRGRVTRYKSDGDQRGQCNGNEWGEYRGNGVT